MTEIDHLKSKIAKQRNEIARLEHKVAQLAADDAPARGDRKRPARADALSRKA